VTVRGSIQVSLFITIVSALAPNQPTTKWVAGALIPGTERSEREADCSPLLNVMVKTEWSISSVVAKTALRTLLDHCSLVQIFSYELRSGIPLIKHT
jgi:hypothetical protein